MNTVCQVREDDDISERGIELVDAETGSTAQSTHGDAGGTEYHFTALTKSFLAHLIIFMEF